MQLVLEDLNLANAERRLCLEALATAGNIVGASALLGITRHAMKRRIIKMRIDWPSRRGYHPVAAAVQPGAQPVAPALGA